MNMTIRRILLFVLIVIVIISIAVNVLILTSLTDRYFQTYLADQYEARVGEIVAYVANSLEGENISYEEIGSTLRTYLDDPIINLRLYDAEENLLVAARDNHMMNHHGGMGSMMRHMGQSEEDQIERHDILYGDENRAYLDVALNSSIANSIVAREFKSSLLSNSTVSVLIALLISMIIGYFISNKMSKAMKDTAKYAQGIQFGDCEKINKSDIVEIRQIRESLEDLSVRLNLKQESRKELMDQLIHQTRTPLTIIKTHVEAIEDGIIEGNAQEMQVVYNEIENISSIISNLSGMIDAQKEKSKVVMEEVEIHSLIKQILSGLRRQFDRKEIALNLNSTAKITVLTDKYVLSQIVYNLLTNAYKYTKEKGYVHVEYELKEDHLFIRVEDNGIGIRAEEQEKIFNAYYRSDDVVTTQGEGIGLYIVMENLKLLSGDIEVHSQLGAGSTFSIILPLKNI